MKREKLKITNNSLRGSELIPRTLTEADISSLQEDISSMVMDIETKEGEIKEHNKPIKQEIKKIKSMLYDHTAHIRSGVILELTDVIYKRDDERGIMELYGTDGVYISERPYTEAEHQSEIL